MGIFIEMIRFRSIFNGDSLNICPFELLKIDPNYSRFNFSIKSILIQGENHGIVVLRGDS